MLSWVIKGGEVYDGSGEPAYQADIGILDGVIVKTGNIEDGEMPAPGRVLDATGLAVAPGFIDIHSHSDLTLPVHSRAESSLVQGITTEVAGSCGWSLAPVKDETARGVLGNLLRGLCGFTGKELRFAWHSFAEYAEHLTKLGIGTNLYPIMGQSLLRAHVVGTGKRAATPEEIAAMRALLRQALADGCRGLSTGRSYLPGGHADTAEIVAMCGELAPYDGIYTSHIKSESTDMLAAVEEVIDIGRQTGVKVQVSHHKSIGPGNFGMVHRSLALMEQARADGIDINCDVYPYDYAQVYMLRDGLARQWRSLAAEKVIGKLRSEDQRDALRRRLGKASGSILAAPQNYLFIEVPGRPELEGQSIGDAAAQAGDDPLDFCCDLLIETELRVKVAARMDEADVQTVLAHPLSMVGTDAFALDGEPLSSLPLHPRHYGSFPRVAGHYRRNVGLFSLPEVIRKLSAAPAAKLGLTDRGLIGGGLCADLVVFDSEAINDRATAAQPTVPPVGIKAVFVRGELAVRDNMPTGVKAGQVLLGR